MLKHKTFSSVHRSGLKTKIPLYLKKIKLENQRRRMLLMKYGRIYLANVFGKISPSQATKHYERKLLVHAFSAWKVFWWNSVVTWRLTLRANCHYRFYLIKKTFIVWQNYICFKQNKKQKMLIAESHHTKKLKMQMLKYLKNYCYISNSLKDNSRVRMEILTIVAKKHNILCRQYEFVVSKLIKIAHRIWTMKQQRKCWFVWKKFTEMNKEKRRRITFAQAENVKRIQRGVFCRWKKYVDCRAKKHQLLKIADDIYKENVITAHFQTWRTRYNDMVLQNNEMDHARNVYKRKQLHLHFQCWQQYAKHMQMNRVIETYANLKLKRQVIQGMKNILEMNRQLRERHHLRVMQVVWKVWTSAVTTSHELRDRDGVEKANRLYRKTMLGKLLKICKEHTVTTKAKRQLKAKSQNLLRLQYLHTWYNLLQEKQYTNRLNSQAIGFYQLTCLRQALRTWHQRHTQAVKQEELTAAAMNHHTYRILYRYFKAWKKWTLDCIEKRTWEEQIKIYSEKKNAIRCIKKWRSVVAHKKMKIIKVKESTEHYNHKLKIICLTAWLQLHQHCKAVEDKIKMSLQKRDTNTLHKIFFNWVKYTKDKKQKKDKNAMVNNMYKTKLLGKALNQWVTYVQYRHCKRNDQVKLYHSEQQLKILILGSYFRQWNNSYRQLIKVEYHYCRKLKVKYMTLWNKQHLKQVAFTQKKVQLKNVYTQVVYKRWMQLWTQCYQQQLAAKQAEAVAVVFWSSNVKRKVFIAWRCCAQQCRQTKQRAYIRAALVAAEENEKRALEYAIRLAKEEFYLARKYYARWCNQVWKKSHETETTLLPGVQRVMPDVNKLEYSSPNEGECVKPRFYLNGSGENSTEQSRNQASAKKHFGRIITRDRPKPRIPNFLSNNIPIITNRRYKSVPDLQASNSPHFNKLLFADCKMVKTNQKSISRKYASQTEILDLDDEDEDACPTHRTYTIEDNISTSSEKTFAAQDQLLPPSYFS